MNSRIWGDCSCKYTSASSHLSYFRRLSVYILSGPSQLSYLRRFDVYIPKCAYSSIAFEAIVLVYTHIHNCAYCSQLVFGAIVRLYTQVRLVISRTLRRYSVYIPKCAGLVNSRIRGNCPYIYPSAPSQVPFLGRLSVYIPKCLVNSRIWGDCPCIYSNAPSQLTYLRRLPIYIYTLVGPLRASPPSSWSYKPYSSDLRLYLRIF